MEQFEVAVVGMGALGSAAAYHLARRGARVVAFEQFGFAVQALISGDVDAVIIDETAGQGYVGENADEVELIGDSLSSDQLGFIFPKGSDLVEPFNAAIRAMIADGTMEELAEKYFSDAFTITYDDIADPE